MKQVFRKIMSFMMALVVLLSTMSLTVDMHFCGENLVDVAIFKEVKTCGMKMKQASKSDGCSVSKKDCCHDETQIIQGQDTLKASSFDTLSLAQQIFVAFFIYTYRTLFEGSQATTNSYRDYVTPLVVREIYKLDETYLI